MKKYITMVLLILGINHQKSKAQGLSFTDVTPKSDSSKHHSHGHSKKEKAVHFDHQDETDSFAHTEKFEFSVEASGGMSLIGQKAFGLSGRFHGKTWTLADREKEGSHVEHIFENRLDVLYMNSPFAVSVEMGTDRFSLDTLSRTPHWKEAVGLTFHPSVIPGVHKYVALGWVSFAYDLAQKHPSFDFMQRMEKQFYITAFFQTTTIRFSPFGLGFTPQCYFQSKGLKDNIMILQGMLSSEKFLQDRLRIGVNSVFLNGIYEGSALELIFNINKKHKNPNWN
jgi:hypothetical protein